MVSEWYKNMCFYFIMRIFIFVSDQLFAYSKLIEFVQYSLVCSCREWRNEEISVIINNLYIFVKFQIDLLLFICFGSDRKLSTEKNNHGFCSSMSINPFNRRLPHILKKNHSLFKVVIENLINKFKRLSTFKNKDQQIEMR